MIQDKVTKPVGWLGRLHAWYAHLTPSQATLLEVGIMFLPAIPAYIWIWPYVERTSNRYVTALIYVYIVASTLVIALRHWKPAQLALTWQGLWPSLAFGLMIILSRTLVILGMGWGWPFNQFSPLNIVGEFLFYYALVGFGEELLFRGLLYHAIEDWRGSRWAIWGTSIGFGLWHIFGQGPLVGITMVLYGLIFALMRRQAGGILGLIIVHGTIDFLAMFMLPDIGLTTLGRPDVPYPWMMLVGLALFVLTPVILWRWYPKKGSMAAVRS